MLYQKTQRHTNCDCSKNSTKLVRHDDQSYVQERGPGITIELPTHLFDHRLAQNLESVSCLSDYSPLWAPASPLTEQTSDRAAR